MPLEPCVSSLAEGRRGDRSRGTDRGRRRGLHLISTLNSRLKHAWQVATARSGVCDDTRRRSKRGTLQLRRGAPRAARGETRGGGEGREQAEADWLPESERLALSPACLGLSTSLAGVDQWRWQSTVRTCPNDDQTED